MNCGGEQPIAMALSGGGIRAMVFHLGLLRFLAENNALERVSRISAVSGGSLVTGLILQECQLRWPSSHEFLQAVYPQLRHKLCTRSLQMGAARQLLRPCNWRYLLSRSNLLASALISEWGVTGRVADLPTHPEISFNGTTAENGKRFRFKRDSLGDYTIGYASPGDFPLASALAVSAAFPGGFGPLALDATRFEWQKRPEWNAPVESQGVVASAFRWLHLYDGGVYDNLGLEPLFDVGRGRPKVCGEFILVSDAGATLKTGFPMGPLSPLRLKRIADVMSDQSRALRVRSFMNYLNLTPDGGAYAYIAEPTVPCTAPGLNPAQFPTTLKTCSNEDFEAIAEHGHLVASENSHLRRLLTV